MKKTDLIIENLQRGTRSDRLKLFNELQSSLWHAEELRKYIGLADLDDGFWRCFDTAVGDLLIIENKINQSLRVINKLKLKLHQIEADMCAIESED